MRSREEWKAEQAEIKSEIRYFKKVRDFSKDKVEQKALVEVFEQLEDELSEIKSEIERLDRQQANTINANASNGGIVVMGDVKNLNNRTNNS